MEQRELTAAGASAALCGLSWMAAAESPASEAICEPVTAVGSVHQQRRTAWAAGHSTGSRTLQRAALGLTLLCAMTCRAAAATATAATHHMYTNATFPTRWPRNGIPTVQCAPSLYIPGQWTTGRNESGEVLFGTNHALLRIWKHQHPVNCRSDSIEYLIHTVSNTGLGSTIHVITAGLATAMDLDRVYLMRNDGVSWVTNPFCKGNGNTMDSCWFVPMSSCTLEDAAAVDPSQVMDLLHNNGYPRSSYSVGEPGFQTTPSVFHKLLHTSPIPQKKWYYWWRAVAAAYVVRPNSRLKEAIKERMAQIFNGTALPQSYVSVHVRRGDKVTEAPDMLLDDKPFFQAAGRLLEADPSLGQTIYLSTEDSETVQYFKAQPGWDVRYTDVQRYHSNSTSVLGHAALIGTDNEVINSMVSLQLALGGRAYVGALVSNWCRLIDELRSTVCCKAHEPYIDPQQLGGIDNLNWK